MSDLVVLGQACACRVILSRNDFLVSGVNTACATVILRLYHGYSNKARHVFTIYYVLSICELFDTGVRVSSRLIPLSGHLLNVTTVCLTPLM